VQKKRNKILAVFSDVNYSPQLIAILQKINERDGKFRIVLMGRKDSPIAQQLKMLEWDLAIIPNRGKIGSIVSLVEICFEIIRFKPKVFFASGQFATAIGIPSSKLLLIPNRIFIRHHSNLHHKYGMKFGIVLDKVANYLATQIVAVSEVVRSVLVDIEGVKESKICLIYNGVSLEKFQESNQNKSSSHTQRYDIDRPFNIGVISRLTEWKGVEYVAEAFVKLQNDFTYSRLHIVGAFADSFPRVSEILSPLNSSVYDISSENSNIAGFLSDMDVFVHVPVGPNDEAFGIVYIEALASKTPCIFTCSGILNELENSHKYFAIVDYRDSEGIYLCLKDLIQQTNVPKMPVTDSWLSKFDLDLMASEYSRVLLREIES
jgi:glycosyltransferase involved in cell wall biosynthesis